MSTNAARAANFNGGIDLWFRQVEGTLTDGYRDLIWKIFVDILNSTPQWSGKAVANWNLSIGEANMTWDPTLGDEIGYHDIAHSKGDTAWIKVAKKRNEPIYNSIKYRDKVFISNGVKGDAGVWTDGKFMDGNNFSYLEAMQDKGSRWYETLRKVNKPYEGVQDSIITVATRYGKKGMTLPRVGGQSWEE